MLAISSKKPPIFVANIMSLYPLAKKVEGYDRDTRQAIDTMSFWSSIRAYVRPFNSLNHTNS